MKALARALSGRDPAGVVVREGKIEFILGVDSVENTIVCCSQFPNNGDERRRIQHTLTKAWNRLR